MSKLGNWFENAETVLGRKTNYGSVGTVATGGTVNLSDPVNLCDADITLPDGTSHGQAVRLVDNSLAGGWVATGTFASPAGNTLTAAAKGSCELIWVTNTGAGADTEGWVVCAPVDGTVLAVTTV